MNLCQRWLLGRDSYRPAGETINPLAYSVEPLASDAEAKSFVTRHHYSGTYPAARFRFGLYHGADLVGVAVFSHPCHDAVLTSVFPGQPLDAVELGRFVLADTVPANGETWFLAQCFTHLRATGLRGVVSFSDPMPRTNRDGLTVFAGHVGTIYQAHNAIYTGRASRRSIRLLPNGTVFSARAISKIRSGERGWHYAATQLLDAGAPTLTADRRAWLTSSLDAVTRLVRHPGNHRYAWPLNRRVSVALARQPFPKTLDA